MVPSEPAAGGEERRTWSSRLDDLLPTVGCFAILLAGIGVAFWIGPLRLLASLVVLVGIVAAWVVAGEWLVVHRFRRAFAPAGKDLLLVTSDGPHWKAYVEEHWLPRWGARAVVINWSERSRWDRARPEIRLFRQFGGDYEYNPLAILVPPRGRHVHVVRFWQAFRDHKHGKTLTLRAAEAELDALLARIGPPAPRPGA